jgi:hypothetical protein
MSALPASVGVGSVLPGSLLLHTPPQADGVPPPTATASGEAASLPEGLLEPGRMDKQMWGGGVGVVMHVQVLGCQCRVATSRSTACAAVQCAWPGCVLPVNGVVQDSLWGPENASAGHHIACATVRQGGPCRTCAAARPASICDLGSCAGVLAFPGLRSMFGGNICWCLLRVQSSIARHTRTRWYMW